jgi:Xaa-Pro aminopeptidase
VKTIDAVAVKDRWRRVHAALDAAGLDALLVSDRLNFTYLTGHQSREFEKRFRQLLFLLDRNEAAHALVPTSEAALIEETAPGLNLQVYKSEPLEADASAAFVKQACGFRLARLGIELSGGDRPCLTGRAMDALVDLLPAVRLEDASPILARSRLIKTTEEIAAIRIAGAMAQAAWVAMLSQLSAGIATRKVAAELAKAFADEGADYNFPGHIEVRNASDPSSPRIAAGQIFWCDFGVTVAGYHSDLSRRAVFGRATDSQLETHQNGHRLLDGLIRSLNPGSEIGTAMLDMLAMRRRLHHGSDLPQRFGHGVGLCAAEAPSIHPAETAILEPGMVLTPEPSFTTADGEFVHLEEMVVIGSDGAVLLTSGAGPLYEVPRT